MQNKSSQHLSLCAKITSSALIRQTESNINFKSSFVLLMFSYCSTLATLSRTTCAKWAHDCEVVVHLYLSMFYFDTTELISTKFIITNLYEELLWKFNFGCYWSNIINFTCTVAHTEVYQLPWTWLIEKNNDRWYK